MISKIEYIKNIGNYEDYTASGDVSLKKMNLIYAENGAGKTTLAQIMHSLSTNDPEIIKNHTRIGATSNPSISIKDDTNHQHIFDGRKWNNQMPNISVFDAHFVANNIYTGFHISSDHRKHLYQFIVGSTGVEIAKKIEKVKGLIESTKTEYNYVCSQIQAATRLNTDDVIKIEIDADIDLKIADKEQELRVAQDNNDILTHTILSAIIIPLPDIDFKGLRELFELTIDGIGKEYLEIVSERIHNLQAHGINKASEWLHDGLDFANKTNKCPYCGSDITSAELVVGYNQYFNEKYENAIKLITNHKQNLSRVNIENTLTQIHNAYEKITELLSFWKRYISVDEDLPPLVTDDTNIKLLFTQLTTALETKQANPMNAIPAECLAELNTKLQDCIDSFKVINAFVEKVNEKIASLRAGLRKAEDVKRELDRLQLIKSRYETPLKNLCSKAEILKRHCDVWNKINHQLQQNQKEQSNALFLQYGAKTNDYLRDVFHTKFLITEIKDGGYKGRAKEANMDYILTFDGTPIEQDGTGNTSFKNVLSEGDKNTIAFSFFLAKLQLDPDVANKIVVFDDPLTSLDLNRRHFTIHQLCNLYPQCKQIIVLSHNLHFLVELNSMKVLRAQDKKVLQIMHNGNNSVIAEYEIKKEWVDKYQKALSSMNDFIQSPTDENKEDAINAIRISLETFLKLKFCLYISNPDGTFGQIADMLERSACTFINPNKSEVIDKLKQLVAISWRGHHGSIEERDIYTETNLSTAETIQYVQMTQNLLSNEL